MSRELELAMTVLAYLELKKLGSEMGRSSLLRSAVGLSFDEEEADEVDVLILVQNRLQDNIVRLSIDRDDQSCREDGKTTDAEIEDIKHQSRIALGKGYMSEGFRLYNQAWELERERRKSGQKFADGEN